MRDHARSTENGTGHILPYAIYGKNERKKICNVSSFKSKYI